VYVGNDITMKVDGVAPFNDAWIVDVVFELGSKGPWGECLAEQQLRYPVRVVPTGPEGALQIENEPGLFGGACPAPLPLAKLSREPARKPKRPTKKPSKADFVQAAKRLDEALWAHDMTAALDAVVCYNLYEESKIGSCSAAELVNVGPMPRGKMRASDGIPWTMNTFKNLDAIGQPEEDKDDPTIFHAEVKAAKGKHKRRTVSVQWQDDRFEIVGVVQRKAEGLTSVEFVVDLDRREKREIFDRRLGGEDIDVRGNPTKDEEDQ
jgi:hypothetical protein